MLLAIDTSTRYAGAALVSTDGQLLRLVHWHSQHNHSVELLPTIKALLIQEDTHVQKLDAIAIAIGPGSFSALRVGLSVAKGLALALKLPMVAVTTLEAEAHPYRMTKAPVVALMDAGRGEIAWAAFAQIHGEFRQTNSAQISPSEELAKKLPTPALICGEGLERHGTDLAKAVAPISNDVQLVLPYLSGLRVSALAHLGHTRLALDQTEDPATLQPLYLRRPTITPPKQPS